MGLRRVDIVVVVESGRLALLIGSIHIPIPILFLEDNIIRIPNIAIDLIKGLLKTAPNRHLNPIRIALKLLILPKPIIILRQDQQILSNVQNGHNLLFLHLRDIVCDMEFLQLELACLDCF